MVTGLEISPDLHRAVVNVCDVNHVCHAKEVQLFIFYCSINVILTLIGTKISNLGEFKSIRIKDIFFNEPSKCHSKFHSFAVGCTHFGAGKSTTLCINYCCPGQMGQVGYYCCCFLSFRIKKKIYLNSGSSISDKILLLRK